MKAPAPARADRAQEGASVLVAWPGPSAETASRVAGDAFRAAFASTPGDTPTRLRAGMAAASARLTAGRSRSDGPGPGARGPIGIGAVAFDGGNAWTLTRGAVDAYVVRDARIASIDRAPRPSHGMPGRGSDEPLRTPLLAGDTLLLASRDLVRELGADELRSAALTLHPDAAAAHLRRLFAAHGGRGSDAALAIDPEVSSDRRRVGPTGARWPSASAGTSAEPPARRAALGLASFASVIAIVGLLVVVLPRGEERAAAQHISLDAAAAAEHITRAENVAASDPAAAQGLYRAAWDALDGTEPVDGEPSAAHAALAARVTSGLDAMRGGAVADIRPLTSFEAGHGEVLKGFVQGPDEDLYVIDAAASVVTRIDAEDGTRDDIVHRGDRAAEGKERIGRPMQLEGAGEALLILDDDARLWRWAPTDGDGTLNPLDLGGEDDWSASVGDIATRLDTNGVRVYLVDPEARNILRFQPTFDGRTYSRSDYLVVDDEAVSGFRQLHVDERVYVLDEAGVRRYEFGRGQQFRLGTPPDDADIRPGHDYRIISGADRSGTQGHLYLYDRAWDRVLVFDKSDGAYVRQWVAPPGDASMHDMRGLAVTTGTRRQPDVLHWMTPSGVYQATVPWAAPADEDDGERAGNREGRRKGRSR